jgi:hypothetical protein
MKKAILLLLLCFVSFAIYGQERSTDSIADLYVKQNEIKLNGLMLLVGAFEASYERNISDDMSVGISFFTPYDTENLDADINYYISPYYRVFFGKKYAAGFFVEGFGMLNSIDRELDSFNTNGNRNKKAVTDFALGFGLGGKWVSRRGFVFELVGGIGRNLFENNFEDSSIVGKFGFNLGYRF